MLKLFTFGNGVLSAKNLASDSSMNPNADLLVIFPAINQVKNTFLSHFLWNSQSFSKFNFCTELSSS